MNTDDTKKDPFVSVIVTCQNEKDFIAPCLDSILKYDFPKNRLEILVVDGMSNDGSREELAEFAAKTSNLRILDNPKKVTPTALNIGIRNARGDVIIWMSSHSDYPPTW
jgi:glycosyltransferase involved in cell wall biosynthesis